MAFTLEDFDKIWASTSPLTPYEFSDSNYKQGWNFIGSTPPARQMWDFLQKRNDEKTQWLYNNKLSLSGGTMTGVITTSTVDFIKKTTNDSHLTFCGGNTYSNSASLYLGGGDSPDVGAFKLRARAERGAKELVGNTDGTLTWNGIGMCGTNIGSAGQSGATLTLPKNGTYLIVVIHNSVSALNGIFMARGWTDGGVAFKLAGADNVTLTCSQNKITVTTTGGTVGVYYIYLG